MLDEDSYNTNVVPLYCAILTEMKKVGELYYLAHKLVSANADSAISWFSVVSELTFSSKLFLWPNTEFIDFASGSLLLFDKEVWFGMEVF